MSENKSRYFCFTYNNYTDAALEMLANVNCKYVLFGKEVAPSTGTPHLQGYVRFKSERAIGGVRKEFGCHVEIAKGSFEENYKYCTKGGDFVERGVKPMTQVEKGDTEKVRWKRIIDAVEGGEYEWLKDNEPRFYAEGERTMSSIRKRCRRDPEPLTDLTNEWWYGPTGTGKSRLAFEENPGAYRKDPKERWWDGYEGQKVVIIDDFDKFQVSQGGDMKRWMDHYPFMAPYKGGYTSIRPEKIIVTSNYHPNEIWEDDQTLNPICRRVNLRSFGEAPVYSLFVPGFKPAN